MRSFSELSSIFEQQFNVRHFPDKPANLYDGAQYLLNLGGKRIRPVCVLMGNELFNDISQDAFEVANAIELFHNFSLVHDDIMDRAPLRRGKPTVHATFGESTALLAGDVMLVAAYDYINRVNDIYLSKIIAIFNHTARQVCEGQQMDMDFETLEAVTLDEYVNMITLKTSVLLAASLQMGAILGGAGLGNQQQLYEFGKKLGIAFQVQDDYLDAFGDPGKVGKQTGGDILSNKKTFLVIHALEVASRDDKKRLRELMKENPGTAEGKQSKLNETLALFKSCKADEWAESLKEKYFNEAMNHLEATAVLSSRKLELASLAEFLMQRDN